MDGALRNRLKSSPFRRRFKLTEEDRDYIQRVGIKKIESHAYDFVSNRLGNPVNDGKQTPMKGHPVFKAQHATACCCRSCLEKWHGIPEGRELTEDEKKYIVGVIMEWITDELETTDS